ncbi:MAG: sulfite exporter TauE/SafE family protein [Desulfuromonas sp.]|nr:MAG: sulfite exporter TauE/SafE family protein [Desulfuromonas sp.]
MSDPLYSMAFTTGLLGSGHCIGMCGGIIAALSLSPEGLRGGYLFHILYNLGRIITYSLIGYVVGLLGSAIAYTDKFMVATKSLLISSDIFIIILGLGTAGAFRNLDFMKLEFPAPAAKITNLVSFMKKLPPGLSALPLGLIMGFLPCGLLYAVAITAAQSANPKSGAIMMLMFGIGTIPALFLFGSAAHLLGTKVRTWMLRLAGVMVALMGCYNLYRHLHLMGIV